MAWPKRAKKPKGRKLELSPNAFLVNPFVKTEEKRCYACSERLVAGKNQSAIFSLCKTCDHFFLEKRNDAWPVLKQWPRSLKRLRDYWLAG